MFEETKNITFKSGIKKAKETAFFGNKITFYVNVIIR